MDVREWRAVVEAAQGGDRQALDELVEGWLPLVYNVVGRALNGHADVDDVVQETMLRAVHHLPALRDPEGFRSWLVAIAMRQVRERLRRRARAEEPVTPAEAEAAAEDFAELAVVRLELDGERREVVEAVRWLDGPDRELLSLWWQEVGGRLTRSEVAGALGISRRHAAVRVQRMKGRLETARGIVRALERSRCRELAKLTGGWEGRPSSVWRKRFARHLRGCRWCGRAREGFVPPERLLVGLALVPVPVGFTVASLLGGGKAAAAGLGAAAASASWSAKVLAAVGKPVAGLTAGASLVAGGAYVIYERTVPHGTPPPPATASANPSPTARSAPSVTGSPTAPPRDTPSPTAEKPRARAAYGSVVDAADRAPDPGRRPGPLPRRADRGLTSSGGGKAVLTHRGESVSLRGTGYVRVRWQILPDQRPGSLVMPTWTRLHGKLFHVASGGGRRMDDRQPGAGDRTWMGSPSGGLTQLPRGAQQMWQNEYFWLDGGVTLHLNESGADYNLIVEPMRREDIRADLGTGPDPAQGVVRYGLVRDTGNDRAPVPQYVTRSSPGDPATVPQRSRLRWGVSSK
ncbi:sigma-70 family RNA polymerase sigma factor [Streptomyces sp. NBC_01186]|uniref:RNA polymerase sigma factor n=1 Tax=Streptomyces sp. NBC_01186 TaxID=2903765 RepID=UPI002E106D52|nr:sigma-70 family RNA polymerase sigma factor [Streptomyces sp. NBC_01186]